MYLVLERYMYCMHIHMYRLLHRASQYVNSERVFKLKPYEDPTYRNVVYIDIRRYINKMF